MQAAPRMRIGPTLTTAHVARMLIEIGRRVVGMMGSHQELIDDIGIIIHAAVAVGILGIEGGTHVDTVKPHLMGIDFLVPEASIVITGMIVELASHQVKRLAVLLLFGAIIDAEDKLTGVDAVQTEVLTLVLHNRTIGSHHRIGISQGIVIDAFIAVAVIHIEHGL